MLATLDLSATGNGRAAPQRYTVDDWATFEGTKNGKYELWDGIFREAGSGSGIEGNAAAHNAISYEFGRVLGNCLEESGTDCVVFGSDQKVYIEKTNGLYPDIVVLCGEPEIGASSALYNPVLVVEVLSPSTAGDDRGEKFAKYRSRPSLMHYVLVEQHRASVEYFRRENGVWILAAEHDSLADILTLPFGGAIVAVPLAAIYRRVMFAVPGETETEADTDTEPAA